MTMDKKRTVETVKQELSKVDDKIDIMVKKLYNKDIDPERVLLDKLCTKQTELGIELEFLTYIMGEK